MCNWTMEEANYEAEIGKSIEDRIIESEENAYVFFVDSRMVDNEDVIICLESMLHLEQDELVKGGISKPDKKKENLLKKYKLAITLCKISPLEDITDEEGNNTYAVDYENGRIYVYLRHRKDEDSDFDYDESGEIIINSITVFDKEEVVLCV